MHKKSQFVSMLQYLYIRRFYLSVFFGTYYVYFIFPMTLIAYFTILLIAYFIPCFRILFS